MRKKKLGTILGALAAVGLVAALVPTLASVTNAADAPASVTVVHGIPSVGNVDVCAGGSTALLTDVPFGGVATISVPAGTYDLTVKVADPTPCAGATAITLDGAVVPAGANVSVVANLTGGMPNLAVYANDVSGVAAGSGRVAVYHAADAPTVDVLVNGAPGISGLAQGQVATADLPTAAYDFTVTPAGDPNTVVLDLPGVTVPAGKLLQVFAVGAVPDTSEQNPFQVITNLVDLPTATTPTTATPTTMAPAAAADATSTDPSFTG
ncbi:MAG: DUF4397 domain-containing protein [Acidimicrobiales bacterium]